MNSLRHHSGSLDEHRTITTIVMPLCGVRRLIAVCMGRDTYGACPVHQGTQLARCLRVRLSARGILLASPEVGLAVSNEASRPDSRHLMRSMA
jgi:hypothetical protein